MKNIATNEEAGRLLAFTNNSSPLFLLVAIPIGMFNNPHLESAFSRTDKSPTWYNLRFYGKKAQYSSNKTVISI